MGSVDYNGVSRLLMTLDDYVSKDVNKGLFVSYWNTASLSPTNRSSEDPTLKNRDCRIGPGGSRWRLPEASRAPLGAASSAPPAGSTYDV
jgi:hypothetical protein